MKPCFQMYILYVYVCTSCEAKWIFYLWVWSTKFESCPKLPRIGIGLK